MAVEFERLSPSQQIVGNSGVPSLAFTIYWQRFCERLESVLDDLIAEEAATVSLDSRLDAEEALSTSFDSRLDTIEAFTNFDPRYVRQDQTAAWADATGTLTRATFATYAGQVVSNPPTQAEVQAIDNHVKLLSERLAALVNDLRANGALT